MYQIVSTCTMCGNPIYSVDISGGTSTNQIPQILRTCSCQVQIIKSSSEEPPRTFVIHFGKY